MQRQARSIQKESITMQDFQSRAFFNVLETDAAYLDQYGNWQKSPDKKSLVRADNGVILLIQKYRYIQIAPLVKMG